MKTCTMCKQELLATLDNFNKNGKYFKSFCKECQKEYQNQYNKSYYVENKTSIKKATASYAKKNVEKQRISKRKWDKNNKHKKTQWRIENREKFRLYDFKYRALKRGNGHEPYTEEQVLDLYGTNCNICTLPVDLSAPRKVGIPGWENGLHIDHVLPISKGGPDILSNVRATHGLCNITKNNKEHYEVQTA